MNIERTIEFILESQAKAEIRMDKSDARAAAMEKRLDKRMDAITKFLQQGLRMLGQTQTYLADLARGQKDLARERKDLARRPKELALAQKELATAQKATDKSLKTLIDSMRHGRNGH